MAWSNVSTVNADDPIVIEWGNAVRNDVMFELLRRDGDVAMLAGAFLTLSSSTPTADNHAVRKKYVDDNFASSTGQVFTGQVTINPAGSDTCLILRSQAQTAGSFNNTPLLAFYNNNAGTRYGYLQGTAANTRLVSDVGGIILDAAAALTINSGTGDITINSGGSQTRIVDAVYVTGNSRFFATATNFVGTGSSCHIDFYPDGTSVDSIGARNGYIGYTGGSALNITNEAGGTGNVIVSTANAITFNTASTPAERVRITSTGELLVGKTTSGVATEGHTLWGNGTAYTTKTGGSTSFSPNIQANRLASIDGELFIEFTRSGTRVGRIEQTGTTGATLVSGSDRRMKTVVGPIGDAVDRIRALKPYRVTWNGDPGHGETDAFIADEVQPVVPEAVFGDPGAVTGPPVDEGDPPEGTPIMQGMAYDKLITVTIAALQDALDEIDTLKAHVDVLEAAA